MKNTNHSFSRAQGFSLIEIVVGVAIGLMCTLIITNVLALAENKRRGTTEGSDARISGSLALYNVSRAIQSAGYGFASEVRAVGCRLQAFRAGANVTSATDANLLPERMTPIVIYPGVGTQSDQVRVISSSKAVDVGSSAGFSLPLRVLKPFAAGGGSITVNSALGVQVGDLMLGVELATGGSDTNCYLMQVNGAPTTDGALKNPLYLLPMNVDDANWNRTGHPAAPLPQRSFLSNMGTISDVIYRVDAQGRLVASTLNVATMTRTDEVLQSNVVRLKALYGRDTTGGDVVNVYDQVQPTTAAGWRSVLNVRLAVVTRSNQFEREEVTTASPLWRVGSAVAVPGSVACGSSKCLPFDVSGIDGWRNYRYSVHETVVGLRNQRWRTGVPLCGASEC